MRTGSSLGIGVKIDSFAVVGGEPQMRVHDAEAVGGTVKIGDRTVIREAVTINRPTRRGGETRVGADCFLMANCHVGHDSMIGDFVTLANNVMLGGNVTLGDHCFIGGGAGLHQFVRVGEGAMIAGNAAISYDVPPFATAADRNDICGLNLLGIRRRGFSADVLPDLKRCYRAVFLGSGNLRAEAAAVLAAGSFGKTPQGYLFLEFFAGGKRGFGHARGQRDRHAGDTATIDGLRPSD